MKRRIIYKKIEETIINCPAIITKKVSYDQRTRNLEFIISVIVGARIVHEITGPVLSKMVLKKAGEII